MHGKKAAFIGRFQPMHKGHMWLIGKKLEQGIPCLILVRDIPPDEKNPFTTEETMSMIEAAYEGQDVVVQAIPDIESVNWGRGVGYETNEFKPPEDIKRISATEIRKRIQSGDESWRQFVNEGVAAWLKNYYGNSEPEPETAELQEGCCLWLTGLSGAGKTTVAVALREALGENVEHLDGDVVRRSFCKDLGFSKADRDENISRISYVAAYLSATGKTTICTFISPYREARAKARNLCQNFIEVHVDCSLDVCEKRDVKGLYKKARAGEIKGFTGIDDPYEAPMHPEIHLRTDQSSLEECVDKIVEYLKNKKLI